MYEDNTTVREEKANWALGLSLVSLLLFGFSSHLSCKFLPREAAAVFGLILLVPSIASHINGKKNKVLYFVSFALNAIANGLIVSVFYLSFQIPLLLKTVLQALLIPSVFLLFAYLFLGVLQKGRAWVTLLLLLGNLAAIALAVYRWLKVDASYYSFVFFGLIFSFIYIIVYSVSLYRPNRSVRRDLSLGSYGIFAVTALVVLAILSEGEALDGLLDGIIEFIGDLFPRSKKQPTAKPQNRR